MPFIFANMDLFQKLVSLEHVIKALIDPDVEEPTLTEWNEATVYAVFEMMKIAVKIEIGTANIDPNSGLACWHRSIFYPICKYIPDPDDETDYSDQYPDSPQCQDSELWASAIEECSQSILWDNDFNLNLGHESPVKLKKLRKKVGIDDVYLSEIAPLDREIDAKKALEYLLSVSKSAH